MTCINAGYGIGPADERVGCAAIARGFIDSTALAGRGLEEDPSGKVLLEQRYFPVAFEKR
jgi:hypothetical protein